MRIALIQCNPTVGDIWGNVTKILEGVYWTKGQGAHLVVFPELSLVGYPPRDLPYREDMLRAVEHALFEIIAPASYSIGILVGAPVRFGEGLWNAALLFYEGKFLAQQAKSLLPNYDVFGEVRYFKPALERRAVLFRDEVLGLTICEDIWNDKDYWQRQLYDLDPLAELVCKKSHFLSIFLSLRITMTKSASEVICLPILLVNMPAPWHM